MERDPTVDYTEHNFHCVISIEELSLTSSLPTFTTLKCVASRLTDAHRELTERDATINYSRRFIFPSRGWMDGWMDGWALPRTLGQTLEQTLMGWLLMAGAALRGRHCGRCSAAHAMSHASGLWAWRVLALHGFG